MGSIRRSIEAEARDILAASDGAGRPEQQLGRHLRALFTDLDVDELEVPTRSGAAGGTVDFDS